MRDGRTTAIVPRATSGRASSGDCEVSEKRARQRLERRFERLAASVNLVEEIGCRYGRRGTDR